MIGLVRIALAKPYTFVVVALLVLIGGALSALRMPTDIFPAIRVPVVAVAWQYSGLSPSEVSGRILVPYQRALTTTVNDIEHIEANSMQGIGVVKIYFQPGVDIRLANAQITAVSQTLLRQLPPGTTPPLVVNYNASTVPILQLALGGRGLGEQQLYDLGYNFIRPKQMTVPGVAMPFPFGGRQRQIQLDIDPVALQSKGISARDVDNALATQTQITPGGFVKIGEFQYNLRLNNVPGTVDQLNELPVRTVDGAVIRMKDVAHVRGSAWQQNVVHVDGQRSVLMTVYKSGATSTIAIVDGVRAMLPDVRIGLPKSLTITALNDQSLFVKAAVNGVAREGALAAVLTSLMILLFLGSWRSTVIVAVSIPLSVLAAIAALSAFGQTLNIMTLGGLALAVGILVDEATATIENINWHLEHGKSVRDAILDGARQIVIPAFLSLVCICIVFVPMFYLPGVAGYLFVPMALAVIFAMIASFLLSMTLVPTMAMYLLRTRVNEQAAGPRLGRVARFQQGFEARFDRFRDGYSALLRTVLANRLPFVAGFLAFALASLVLVPFLGRNFFPQVDAGSMAIHVREPTGMRVEETSALLARVEAEIRRTIPADELLSVADNIGLPTSALSTSYNASGTIGSQDGDVLVALKPGHGPTEGYVRKLRHAFATDFPTATFAFLPADITSQILNFGSPAPIDIQFSGTDPQASLAFAQRTMRELRTIDGLADARIQQPSDYPELRFDADRTRMGQLGLSEADVTASVATLLAGTVQTAPVFWLNPKNGVTYPVVAQMPEYRIDDLDQLRNLPVNGTGEAQATRALGGLGDLSRGTTEAVLTQYNIAPTIDIYATTDRRDLGAVAADIRNVLKRLDRHRPETVKVALRGQYQTMNTAFSGMEWGILAAVVLIYLLIVINFQSWADPFIIVSALPAALAGISWMLFATGTPLSVPALTGAIMCMGVATANSILVVSFARERLAETGDAVAAALEAGATRLRPVLMTALSMIIGMAPLALGLGDGGEQNAPLGRAVIGGLAFATCASLLFVPTMFAIIHGRAARRTPPLQGAAHAH